MSEPFITFLSDYGLQDEFVGVCHGVIATICPSARVIDISHNIPRHDVLAGALMLQAAVPFTPVGVHLAVVDPDVGAGRRAVALRTVDERLLVGPDNGLLAAVGERCGGVTEAVDIAHSPFRLEPVSATFHGRDIFAPVAAQLAAGVALADTGDPCDPAELVALELPRARSQDGVLLAQVILRDSFGNLGLNVGHAELSELGLKLGHHVRIQTVAGAEHQALYARTFADVPAGELIVYEDAARRLAVAVSHGDAGRILGLAVRDELRICPA